MNWAERNSGRSNWRRTLAVLGCVALLYLAAGGAFLHQHPQHARGPDFPCHICQATHVPALAAAQLDLVAKITQVAWYSSAPTHAKASDSFKLHRASRAPPTA